VSSRRRLACAALALVFAARPAAAGDTALARVEKTLAAARAGEAPAGDRAGLPSLAADLEQQARAQRAEFDAAAARPLPGKARARLEATRQAWEAAQGRLPGLLRSGRVEEALALVERLRAASRPAPLSAGELKTRVPALRPPALSLGAATAAVPSGDAPIGTIAPEVRQQAEAFSGPIEIYEWVRNAVRPELYHGLMKGPLQTLLESSGNDADTAGLLIALLRAKGIPARYVRGTVDLPAAAAVAVTGTASPQRALRAFERAGIPAEPLPGPGSIAAIRVERVWAEAYLPYANYRGALLDAHEKVWVPLDPGFKRLAPPGGIDLRSLGFEPDEVFDGYLAAAPGRTPLEAYRSRAEDVLSGQRPDLAYEEALARRDVVAQNLGLLPGTLPYTLVARAEVSYEPPEPLVHTARFVLESDGAGLLDATFPTTALLGQRLTLSYVPLEESDEEVVRQYGGLFATPPYLVEVRPVLKLGGLVLASGTGGSGLGVTLDFRIELTTPGGQDAVSNRVLAGNLTAIGLAAGRVTADESEQDEAARVLARLAFHYLDHWNRSDEELAALLRVVPIRPSVSTCLVQSAVEVDYAGGDPLYPVRYDWKGLAIDADRRPSAPAGIEADAAERDFLLASGLEGSVLEHRLFEDDLDIASVSTAKSLQLAGQGGIEVLDLRPENAEALLAGLPLDERVKEEIRAGVASGYHARVPAAPLSLLAWSGVGYLIFDPATGESAWQLQGGHSGGVTAPAVVDLPAHLVDVVRRQSETPSPRPGGVAYLQKFDTTDYQFGTVDTPLAKPFKVLATDENGFPVPGAAVTFSVIGGGGLFVDPTTGRASASEITVPSCVGGEKEGPCASLKPGEAVATLQLGRLTSEIPYYTCESPFTCTCPPGQDDCDRDRNGIGYATQVGMNLVTVSSGAVVLAEPFSAFGFPERPPVEGKPGEVWVHVSLAASPASNPVNLTVADRLSLRVTDRFGNPISNKILKVAYEGPPELMPLPAGHSYLRTATSTPGRVLRAFDYAKCIESTPSVIWGECAGEADGVQARSSSAGAFFFPVVGDSPLSYYKFNVGTLSTPVVGWVKYSTNGVWCPNPDPKYCADRDVPVTWVWQGTRPVLVNAQGNLVEAYPPGDTAEAGFWADVVYEEARVERRVGAGGREYFRAKGTNVWKRERLPDSELSLHTLTEGTGVAGTAAPDGNGGYTAPMTMGAVPQLNSVEVVGKHYPPLVKYLEATGGDVDPATVDPVNLTLTRVKDPRRPIQVTGQFDLWGVDARIKRVEPTPVLLNSGGVVTRTSFVNHEVKPPEYFSLLTPRELRFEVRTVVGDKAVLAANGGSDPHFEVPAGLALPEGRYYGQVRVRGVSAGGADIVSDRFTLPVCSLLALETPQVRVHLTRDPVNGRSCGTGDSLRFHLCRPARVTLTVKGEAFTGSIDGTDPRAVADVLLPAGPHAVLVPAGLLELESDEQVPFTLEARDAEDPSQVTVAPGVILSNVTNRSVLPVGHTFVKGVDLLDGHLVQQSTDLKVPGRHLGLELTRTYSSAGWSSDGPLGGGWSLNYAGRLFEDGSCGLVTVVTPDGGSQVFQSDDGLVTFTPQKGYHTRLERDGRTYRFIDKAGNVHHFESPDADGRPRLDFIEEPHGDRLVFTYDGASLLTKVAEVQAEAGEVRAVTFAYQTFNGAERIVKAEIASLGLVVEYEYDARGNLVKATRSGSNLGADPAAEPRVEKYGYLGAGATTGLDLRREHQLVETTDPNGLRREYVYFGDDDRLPGEVDGRLPAGGLLFTERWELVKQVVEHPEPALSIRTEFSYDAREVVARSQWKTTVRDGRGHDTVYVLNGNGSPLRIEEPLGKTTTMAWAPDDILKTSETDANGRTTEFGYDTRGNLTLERIVTGDLGPVVTEYRYDTRFNKLTWKKDPEGRETEYSIDSATGDLLATVDPVGNRTSYTYDEHGRLQTVTDPRKSVTQHRAWDSFGNAGEIVDPLGNVTTRTFDLRGRLRLQSDTMGRQTTQTWDGLDRLIETVRVAGFGSDDEVTETAYYPGGEVRSVKNANGAETTYTIDGLSRVVATRTRFDGLDLTTATTYDANGNKETETDRRGVTKRFVYDELNRLTAIQVASGLPGEGPTGTISEYGYDLVGNKTSETNLAGLTTRFELDGLYRVKAKVLPETMPEGRAPAGPLTERFAYDKVGNRTSATDPNGHTTTSEYDGLDRLIRTTNALDQVTTVAYDDPEGSHVNKSEEHDKTRGLRTTFRYDRLNRETERVVHLEGEGGNATAYTTATAYDDDNHSVTVTNPRGFATVTRLDGLDRPYEQVVDPGGLGLVTRTTYDGLGNKKTVTDPNDHTTRYRHDGLGRLVEVIDAAGKPTASTYDGEGLRTGEKDRRGIEKVFTYDNLGRPRREALAAAPLSGKGWSRETRYRDRERHRIEIDALGRATRFDLDGLDRVVRETDALGHYRTFTWDGVNRVAETDKRPAHHRTLFEYDELDRVTKVTDPPPPEDPTALKTYETAYEDALNRVTEKDRRGTLKRTQMDPLGRVLGVTRALGEPEEATLERNTYDGVGNKTTQADAEGRVTRFVYDAANRLASRTDGFGTDDAATTTFVYDKAGNLLEERDARAAALGEPWSVKRTWDELNRLETEANGEGNVTRYGYDPEGNRTSITTPKSKTTTFEYDELGKLTKVTQPTVPLAAGGTIAPETRHVYDEARNRILQTDANGHVVAMEYDELNRLKKTTQDPGGLNLVTDTVQFDENGNPLVVRDPKRQTITSTFDELNRLKTKSYAFAPGDATRPWRYTASIDYGYDENGNLLTTDEYVASGTDPPDTTLTTTRTYDGLDRLKSETQPLADRSNRTVRYTYYRNGLRKTVTDPAETVTQYAYDGQNRLETATTGFGTADAQTTRYTYWPDDLLHTVTYPNGAVATHDYDKADRLLTLANARVATPVSSYTYSYDPNGNRLTQIEVNGGQTETTGYGYDDLDRLGSVTYPVDAAYPQGRAVAYGYDAVGNRVRETEKDSADTLLADKQGAFDAANRLTELQDLVTPAESTSFTWDANGNQLTKTTAGVTTENRYDLRDKLVEVHLLGSPAPLARFQYDAQGRRNLKIGDEDLRQYVYDQTSLLVEYDVGGLQKAKYDYGSDRLISLTRADEGRRYFSLDGLRSVVNLTDDSGAAVASYHLDAWGSFRFASELASSANRFAFTGHIWDQETGLYNAKARYFDPKLGRFLTQDSFPGQIDEPPSLHRYAYGQNRPTYYIDPDGHIVFIPIAIAIVKVAALVGVIAAEAEVIRQEVSEGKDLSTVDYGKAAKTGAVAAGATAAGGLAGAGVLAGTAALGIGGAAGSAAISATVGGAVGGYAGGAGSTLAEGGSLAEAHDRGAIGALTGAVGGVAGQAAGSLAARAGAGRVGSAFAGGAAGDYAGQQTLVGAGLQEKANIGQSLAVGGASAITGIVAESSRGHGNPPRLREPLEQGSIEAAPKSGVGKWEGANVLGRRVYQRKDLFDPTKRSAWFDEAAQEWRRGTNIERMQAGLAPVDSAGRPIQLHHLTGTEVNAFAGTRGALAETRVDMHQKHLSALHIPEVHRNPNIPRQTIPRYPSFRKTNIGERSVQADEFEAYRRLYWQERAKGFQ
jgi:RHS repeat-associated protein